MRRIQRLESLASAPDQSEFFGDYQSNRRRKWHPVLPVITVQYGRVRRLPADFQGERHIVVSEHLPDRNGQKWVEYAEVPSLPPSMPPTNPRRLCINVMFVEARDC